jgi:hypothetical protein
MKQTAVEWLRDLYENRPVNMLMSVLTYEEYILEDEWEEALKMEKEQIVNAWENGWENDSVRDDEVESAATKYYNETFKTNEK